MFCTASDQVAESYDVARATLATKLATMSAKKIMHRLSQFDALMHLNKEYFISDISTTPGPRSQHSKLEMPSEGGPVVLATSLHCARQTYRKKCFSARVIDDTIFTC
jgi:hypothetical protein